LFILFLFTLSGCNTLKVIELRLTLPTRVECFSGGKLIYKGIPESVLREESLTIIKDSVTKEFIKLEGDCLYYYK